MNFRERFGANLREAREGLDLTQEELGFRAGLHRTEISLLERGEREPRFGTLLKVVDALETDCESLRRGIRWLPEPNRFDVEG